MAKTGNNKATGPTPRKSAAKKPTAARPPAPAPKPRPAAPRIKDVAESKAIGRLADQLAALARDLGESRRLVKLAGDEAGRDLATLADRVKAAFAEFHKEVLGGLDRARAAAADVTTELTSARRLAQDVGRLLPKVSGQVEQVKEDLATLPRRTEEARQQVKDVLDQLAEIHTAVQGPAPPTEARNRLGVTVEPGVVVAEVLPGTPADGAGLVRGDVIERVNSTAVRTAVELRDAVAAIPDGNEVLLLLTRGGQTREAVARLDEPHEREAPAEGRNRLGVTVEPGVVVAEVLPESPAAAAGLARGDVIESANGHPVHTGEQLREAVCPLPGHAEVALKLTHAGQTREVTARLGEPPTS
jgi:PDZ domain-containing secreted protein